MGTPAASAARLADHPLRSGRLATSLAIAGFAAYFVALHALIVHDATPALTLVVVLAPWAIAAVALAVDAARRASVAGRCALAVAAIGVLAAGAWFVSRLGAAWTGSAQTVLYAENVAFFAWLGSLFALTLVPGREPLVTQMARRVRRGDMPPSLVRYARRATVAWAAFFFVVVAVSSALFFGASRSTWSLFVNLLIWPCVASMFAAEYAVRLAVLRDVRHDPIWAGVEAFRRRDEQATHERTPASTSASIR